MGILNTLRHELWRIEPIILGMRTSVNYKKDNSPVTEADMFLDNFISNFLTTEIPNIHICSEEKVCIAHDQSRTIAVVDPLDGTENFSAGLEIWGVSVSIWDSDKHLESGLFFPELRKSLITGDQPTFYKSRISAFSSSISLSALLERGTINRESRIMGCASYNFYNMAIGAFSSFENFKGASNWDILGGLMLCLENECEVEVDGKIYSGEYLSRDTKHTFKVSRKHSNHIRER